MSLMSLALKCWRGKGQVPDHTFSDVGVNAFPVSQARTGAGVQNSDPRATRSPTQWALRPQPPIRSRAGRADKWAPLRSALPLQSSPATYKHRRFGVELVRAAECARIQNEFGIANT